jgi:hypothetical protein
MNLTKPRCYYCVLHHALASTLVSGLLLAIASAHPSVQQQTGGAGGQAVWGWGWNSFGQLGNGTTNDTSTPLQVYDLSGV